MIDFQNPAAFLLLLLIPLFFVLRYLKIFKQITFPAVLADWKGKSFTWKDNFRKFLSGLSTAIVIIALILVVIAFADPVRSIQEKVYTSLGTDIVFVLDTSPSMAAKDVDGETRLSAAENAINSLMTSQDGNRFGVVIFGSGSAVLVPPTSDIQTIKQRLSELQIGIIGNGSAIGDGLSTAVCHLAASSAQNRCIILLTDGENNAGEIHPETAANLAKENNIKLYVIGIGSKGTVPIEYTDPTSGRQYFGYLDSDFNSASLRKIASIGGGRYFEGRTLEELKVMLNSVAKTENVPQTYVYRTSTTQYYQQVLIVAIILVLISWFFKRFILKELLSYKYSRILILRTILITLSVLMLFLAYSGLSWGTYLAPVQKNSTAVSFVFDISNSMLADDCEGETTRLDAASLYAKKLLSKMHGTPVSVVLAKGDGVAAIPLTEDYTIIESLLDVINPKLMTVPGTSIGKGILKAKKTFPANFSAAGRIWVFTDCEETDNSLSPALTECIRDGIPVTILGFGSMQEMEILAGDGVTRVHTALRPEIVQDAIESAGKKLAFYKKQTPVTYQYSAERGAAYNLLNQLIENTGEEQVLSYEAKPVPRFKFFLFLGIIFFILSFALVELDIKKLFEGFSHREKSSKVKETAALIVIATLFTSCSSDTNAILRGTYAWHQKQYRKSISLYLNVLENAQANENQTVKDVALYDLGTSYSMLGEDEAAMLRFSQISEDANDSIRFAAYYNAGIIAHKNSQFQTAQEYFRKALEIDNSKVNAKINMELSMMQAESQAKQSKSQTNPAAQESSSIPDMEKAVFEHIKENDKKQWKNSETHQIQDLSEDY